MDVNISWKDHIKTTEKKISHKYWFIISRKTSKTISWRDVLKNHIFFIYSFIFKLCKHSWASTPITKLKPTLYKQKQFNEGRLSHSKPLFKILNALNVCNINLYQHLNFMHRLGNRYTCCISWHRKKTRAQIPNKIFELKLHLKKVSFTNSRFSISFWGPKLWNENLNKEEKGLESHRLSKICVKSKLLGMENEYSYFKKLRNLNYPFLI